MKKLKFIFLTILSVYGQTDSAEDFEEIELELKQGKIKGFVRDYVEDSSMKNIAEFHSLCRHWERNVGNRVAYWNNFRILERIFNVKLSAYSILAEYGHVVKKIV